MTMNGSRNLGAMILRGDRNLTLAHIAAFEIAPNEYELISLSPEIYREAMRNSPTGKGRVGLVQERIFAEKGSFIAKVRIADVTK